MKECVVCQQIFGDEVERCSRDRSPLKIALPGMPIVGDRYRIDKHIGTGGLGLVYAGTDLQNNSPVAIKLIGPEFVLTDPNMVAIFYQAAETMKANEHPNIVKVFDYGQNSNNTLYLVMEYLEGCTLPKLMEQEPELEISRANKMIFQICAALISLHHRGQLYGHLKPANIMVVYSEDNGEQIKLLDCGFSWLKTQRLFSSLPPGLSQRLMDDAHYLSPEVCDGEENDARSEVYALGVICFYLLTGRPIFVADSHYVVMTQHISAPPPSLRAIRESVPEALELVINRTLVKDPKQRLQTPSAFLKMLKMALISGNEVNTGHLPAAPVMQAVSAQSAQSAQALQNSVRLLKPISQTNRLGFEFLGSIEKTIQDGLRFAQFLRPGDINSADIVKQLERQFAAKSIWQEGANYIPNIVTLTVPRTSSDRMREFEAIFQSALFLSNIYKYAGELGYQLLGILDVNVMVSDQLEAGKVEINVEWPDPQEVTNGLDVVPQVKEQRIITDRPRAVISRVALLQSINANTHHEQYLIVRPNTYLGRFRNILDQQSGELIRRNDFAFLQSNDPKSPNYSVSRMHALIEFRGTDFYLIDLKSRNGTVILRRGGLTLDVNPIAAEGIKLQDQDIIRLGLAMLSFELVEDPSRIEELVEQIDHQAAIQTPYGNNGELFRTHPAVTLTNGASF